jgi:GNAT superfamily N-acetyltransferase
MKPCGMWIALFGGTRETMMQISTLNADQIQRVFEIDRTEHIEAEYIPEPSDDGFAIRATLRSYDPPRVFPNWDEEGRRRRAEWWRRELEKGGALIVAEENGHVVGFAIRAHSKPDHSAEIIGLFVDAGDRGHGVGRLLLEALEQNARESRIRALYGGVNATERTIRFYLRNGYRIKALIDESIDTWPLAETAIVMAKSLASGCTETRKPAG